MAQIQIAQRRILVWIADGRDSLPFVSLPRSLLNFTEKSTRVSVLHVLIKRPIIPPSEMVSILCTVCFQQSRWLYVILLHWFILIQRAWTLARLFCVPMSQSVKYGRPEHIEKNEGDQESSWKRTYRRLVDPQRVKRSQSGLATLAYVDWRHVETQIVKARNRPVTDKAMYYQGMNFRSIKSALMAHSLYTQLMNDLKD